MTQRILTQLDSFWPALAQADDEIRQTAVQQLLLTAVSLPLAIVTVIWLIAWSNWTAVQSTAVFWELLLFLLLRLGLAQFDFSAVLDAGHPLLRRGQGRFVTWTAVLLFGPIAFWLEPILALLQIGARLPRIRAAGVLRRQQHWFHLNYFLLIWGRDVLPGLAAVWLLGIGGETLPLSLAAWVDLLPVLWATLAKMGFFMLLMIPYFAAYQYGRRRSWLAWLERIFTLGLTLVLLYALPELLSLAGLVAYQWVDLWAFLGLMAVVIGAGGLAHWVNRTAVQHQNRTRELFHLERLGRAILNAPPDDTNLPDLLAAHVPSIFPDCWMEIRLLPDQILYFYGPGWVPSGDYIWQKLAHANQIYWLVAAVPEAVARGFSARALLLPLFDADREQVIGGIYLLRRWTDDVLAWQPTAQALAAQLEAGLQRNDLFELALASQADAFREEVYAQAYQAEVYAQALAYEKLSQELMLAGEIQASFLPQQVPELPGWQLAVTLEPARETSGDFYDFIPLPDGRLGLLVADVADKGIGAALYMALSRTLIRIFAVEHQSPEQALAAANARILSDTNTDMFVTVFYAILDPETGDMTYCNAGHNPPYLQYANGDPMRSLTRTALPLGIFEHGEWQRGSVQIRPGDLLIVYSDGVTEAEDETEDFFGEERLQAIMQKNRGRSAEVIENKLVSAIYEFVGDAPQHDDITIMIIAREKLAADFADYPDLPHRA